MRRALDNGKRPSFKNNQFSVCGNYGSSSLVEDAANPAPPGSWILAPIFASFVPFRGSLFGSVTRLEHHLDPLLVFHDVERLIPLRDRKAMGDQPLSIYFSFGE